MATWVMLNSAESPIEVAPEVSNPGVPGPSDAATILGNQPRLVPCLPVMRLIPYDDMHPDLDRLVQQVDQARVAGRE